MPLRFIIDECTVSKELRTAIASRSAADKQPIDVVWVGDADAPPAGTLDSELLTWAFENDRAIVTGDSNTLIALYCDYVTKKTLAGQELPPPLIVRQNHHVKSELSEHLVIASQCFGPNEYGQVIYYPDG